MLNVFIYDSTPRFVRCASKFTAKERDTESGNDYFGARYYSSAMGRFMSPDYSSDDDGPQTVPYADLENPQSLNLYGYLTNNPMSLTDPNGHSQDTYVADIEKHGGPHIDRYDKNGNNVGRYNADGTPLPFKNKMPNPVPNSDKGKFEQAKKQLEKKIKQKEQADANSSGPTKMQQLEITAAVKVFSSVVHGVADFQNWLNNLSLHPPTLPPPPPPPLNPEALPPPIYPFLFGPMSITQN